MTDNLEGAIARNVERCKNRDGMSTADADAILDAHAQLELLGRSGVSPHHHSDGRRPSAAP